MRVDVRPYSHAWPIAFQELKASLSLALAGVEIVAIEHVGSTSVPGLAAKPIIDVDIVVPGHEQVAAAGAALEGVGYVGHGDLGVPDRYGFGAPDADPARNVYVTIDGCLSLRNHLGVRQVLRTDDELRQRYSRLKLSLSEREYDHIGQYVADKSPVLQLILTRAGLTDDELGAIAQVNAGDDG